MITKKRKHIDVKINKTARVVSYNVYDSFLRPDFLEESQSRKTPRELYILAARNNKEKTNASLIHNMTSE